MVIQRAITASASAFSIILSPRSVCYDIHRCRSIPGIVFSCASTVLLWSWVAFHPDIPPQPQRAWWKKLLERIGWTLVAIFAPEAILIRALFQWTDACSKLKKLHKKFPDCEWTELHAMFAVMGGFRIVNYDGIVQPLVGKETFLDKILKGDVDVPKIREDEIKDKSKADYLARTIAVAQTLWFGIQAAYRVSKGLDVTKLELTTLGYVVLNLFICWCWWNKPRNIHLPIDVRPKKKERPATWTRYKKHYKDEVVRDPESTISTAKLCPLSFRVRTVTVTDKTWGGLAVFLIMILLLVVSGLFGGIHCLAWNSTSPTYAEQLLWQICVTVVAAIPMIGVVIFAFHLQSDKSDKTESMMITTECLFLILYGIARVCLLVLAGAALRRLPESAYETASWTFYLPHID